MRQYTLETIIIKKDAWAYLRNLDRTTRGYSELSEEQLERSWNRIPYRNNGANPDTHPIADDEIRIDKGHFGFPLERVKEIIREQQFEWRRDGYTINGINL